MNDATRGHIFTPEPNLEIAVSALTAAIHTQTDAVSRLANNNAVQDGKLDHIMLTLGDMTTRLTLIERTPISGRLDKLERKVETLENDRRDRAAQVRMVEWIFKNWPGVIGFVALIGTIVVLSGKVHF